jgi:photosystem II stability/assembly factor-like uncharacterized protein
LSARAATLVALALLAGCAPGKSIVTVTLDADAAAPVGPIAGLTVTPSDASGHKDTISIPVGATIPPAYTFSLRFDASVKTTIHLSIVALDDNGQAIGSASGDVDVKPSATARLPLTLTPLVPPPPGSTLAFTTQPTDALKNTALAPVRVTVLDAGGAAVTSTNVPITLSIATNPSMGVLAGTLTVNATAGVATFSDLSIDTPGSGYTLSATAPGATDGTSAAFAIKSTGWVAQNSGLTGGVINDLILDPKHPQTLYAASADNGVWKSIDGGNNWARAATGLPRRHSVDALAIDPITTTTLWAACGDAGVYKSSDSGNSWVQSTSMVIAQGQYAAIAVDPSHPMWVYAAANRAVVRTGDGGATWASVATNATYGAGPRSIAIHPTTGAVWVAQFGDGIATMPYMGTTFTAANGSTGVIPGVHPYMKCIAFNPYNPVQMFASGDISPTVFVSGDGGANWTAAATAPANAPVRMGGYIGAGGAVRMYGAIPELGVISTPTATNKWDYGSAGISGAVAVAVDPGTQNLVYAATTTGVMRTSDSFNFTGVNNGLVGHGAWTVAVDPKNGTKLYVGMRHGLFRSTDSGQSWAAPTSPMPGAVNVYSLAIDFTDDKQLYLGTDNWSFHSADFGATWTAVSNGTTVAAIYSLAAAPSVSGTFFAGGGTADAYTIAAGGPTWTAASSGLPAGRVNALVVHPTNAMLVYAATAMGGVFKTIDSGATWTAATTGITSTNVVGLALDPTTPATLYAATADKGVFKSTDSGANWSASSTGLPSMVTSAIALAPSQPATLYVATDKGVQQSLDGGATWAAYNAGLGNADVNALVVDPTDPLTAYAATWDGGVFKNVTQ